MDARELEGPINEEFESDIRGILWSMFRQGEPPKHQTKAVAADMNISPDALNKYIRGSLPLPAYLVPRLYAATGELAILAWIVSRCEGVTLRELGEHPECDGDVTDDLEQVMIATFELFRAKVEAYRDGELDRAEKGKLYLHGLNLHRQLDGLLAELNPEAVRERSAV